MKWTRWDVIYHFIYALVKREISFSLLSFEFFFVWLFYPPSFNRAERRALRKIGRRMSIWKE